MSKRLTKNSNPRDLARMRRRRHIRKSIVGTPERPRLAVFRSARHIYAQVIDDTQGRTLAAVSTLNPDLKTELEGKNKREKAKRIGLEIAKRCLDSQIPSVVFDRGGYLYQGGRISALAEGAREGGLQF